LERSKYFKKNGKKNKNEIDAIEGKRKMKNLIVLLKSYFTIIIMEKNISSILFVFFFCTFLNAQDQSTIESIITEISKEVDSSQSIIKNEHAKKIISYGVDVIPTLTELYTDSSPTKIYSSCLDRFLNKGEIAIILTDRIERMPYYIVTRIQNCTMDFCENNPNHIEYYFGYIQRDGLNLFKQRYVTWFNSKERRKRNQRNSEDK
jgi:hypothetical protein